MKLVHVLIPVGLTTAFALIYPNLEDRDWLEIQKRELAKRAESYDFKHERSSETTSGPRCEIQDAEAAITAAEAVWSESYGAENVRQHRPILAVEANGRWHVQGTLPRGAVGGVPYIILAKADGRVIHVSHGK